MASHLRNARGRRAETFGTHLLRPGQQAHQLCAIPREMRVYTAAGNYVSSEIGTLRCAAFYVGYLGLLYAFVAWLNSQGDTGTRERDFR